ncbi:MAG: glutamate synthase large subunit [Chlorobi bacterium]|nr:glutamate synthase large subunit [Chlorobiota bacterium]
MFNTLYNPENEHDNCGIGFVAHIRGHKSSDIVNRGLEILQNMKHRGAESADNKSGDGAGILTQIPHSLYLKEGLTLPSPGQYGTGLVFLPKIEKEAEQCKKWIEEIAVQQNLSVLFYRDIAVDASSLGDITRKSEPFITQIFIHGEMEEDDLERQLYIVRKQVEKRVNNAELTEKNLFYIPSLSTKTIIYKGMFTPDQLRLYYDDLRNPEYTSAIALIHSRFSTNTFPTWDLAQPFRYIAHNGEINTIRGNRLWMHARESIIKSQLLGVELSRLFPVIEPGKSDSASLDNALEFLVKTGRSIPHALSMLIPESWNEKNPIPASLKAFYEYHSTFMEPWDGPAAILFSDGRYVGGTLDRNGLRPSRYLITNNDLIVMASETGVQEFKGNEIREKGRLKPGKILLVDTQLGVILPDREVKSSLARRQPYANWLKENRLDMEQIRVVTRTSPSLGKKHEPYLKAFGYTKEDIDLIIKPMAAQSKEPISSMGNDTPPAVLSRKPQRLFNYFRQIFAQVTNPPIDPIRERVVMALTNYIGSVQKNLLEETPEHCKLIKFTSPIMTNTNLRKILDLKHEAFTHRVLPMVFDADSGGSGLKKALKKLCIDAEKAVDSGCNFIILTDRPVSKNRCAIPSLLAVSAVHHYLIRHQKRMQTGLIVETGEAREVTHFAQLLAYGASMINPYVCFSILENLTTAGKLDMTYAQARTHYIKAIDKGILKILSKMGISTLRSYHGSQMFEAIGLSSSLIDQYFPGTTSRIEGIGLEEIAREAVMAHHHAFFHLNGNNRLPYAGTYAYRINGEQHAWNPETIALLQWATRTGSYEKFKEFTGKADADTKSPLFLRGLVDFKTKPIAVREVESEELLMRRFVTGAMSFGSLSKEAHETLAIAMNSIHGRSNTGEGGEDPKRFIPGENGTNKRSAIKQIASGRFGVNTYYLVNADEIQIKIAQGAKPGEGGQLPGYKVNKVVARIRHSIPGITLISPPPHHDIYSIEDLAQLIYDLKCVNPDAMISVKLVSVQGVGTIAAGVAKAHADLITISGSEGGTGASPASSIKHAGAPLELGLAETHQTLVRNNLRSRVILQTDGQLKTGRDIVIAAMLGAEEFGFATAALIALGCVMMRKCHMNTCPAGVATQDEELRKRFSGKPEALVNYFRFLAREVREYMAQLGFRTFDEMVGRTDRLIQRNDISLWKAAKIKLNKIIAYTDKPDEDAGQTAVKVPYKIENPLDEEIIRQAEKSLQRKERVWISKPVHNTDRATGTMLSGKVATIYGEDGLPEDTIMCNLYGSAGQSFGAFLAPGITLRLEGDANDYLGKGLSGGKIIVVPPKDTVFNPSQNIIAGNTILYGATSGEVFINGVAGERFAVRNSGARAVVEGVGDHGCEYMTGGRVVILGSTGRNFAAGMSGGIAYVLDENGNFPYFCNQELVEISDLSSYEEVQELQNLISEHLKNTQSTKAEKILAGWEAYATKFRKIIPWEYKKILNEQKLLEIKKELEKADFDPDFAE